MTSLSEMKGSILQSSDNVFFDYIVKLQIMSLFIICLSYSIFYFASDNIISISLAFLILNFIAISFIVYELKKFKSISPIMWWLNPLVLCSFMFILRYLLSNMIFYLPSSIFQFTEYMPELNIYSVKMMFLIILAVISMWNGYFSIMPNTILKLPIFQKIGLNYKFDLLIPKDNILISLFIFSIAIRVLQIKLGIYGVMMTLNAQEARQYDGVSQFFNISGKFGLLALFVFSLKVYSKNKNIKLKSVDTVLLYTICIIEVLLGVVAGFKGSVVLPFLIILLCQYVMSGKVSKKLLMTTFCVLIFAFSTIGVYRGILKSNISSGSSSIGFTDIVSKVYDTPEEVNSSPLAAVILSRVNLSFVGAKGVEYKDSGYKTFSDPDFFGKVVFAPISAFVPRFIWSGKGLSDEGVWYTNVVFRNFFSISSTAMGLVTHLYFAGGVIFIVLGFYFIGIMQNIIFNLFKPWMSISGALMFLLFLPFVAVNLEYLYDFIIISVLRLIPEVYVLQKILFTKRLVE